MGKRDDRSPFSTPQLVCKDCGRDLDHVYCERWLEHVRVNARQYAYWIALIGSWLLVGLGLYGWATS